MRFPAALVVLLTTASLAAAIPLGLFAPPDGVNEKIAMGSHLSPDLPVHEKRGPTKVLDSDTLLAKAVDVDVEDTLLAHGSTKVATGDTVLAREVEVIDSEDNFLAIRGTPFPA